MLDAPCNQICSNTEGSYVCTCNNGYSLDSDGYTCSGKLFVYYKYITHFNGQILMSACWPYKMEVVSALVIKCVRTIPVALAVCVLKELYLKEIGV